MIRNYVLFKRKFQFCSILFILNSVHDDSEGLEIKLYDLWTY